MVGGSRQILMHRILIGSGFKMIETGYLERPLNLRNVMSLPSQSIICHLLPHQKNPQQAFTGIFTRNKPVINLFWQLQLGYSNIFLQQIIMKSTLILLTLLVFIVATPHSYDSQPAHQGVFNLPCCNSYGGILCGYIFKTCCLGRCNNWLVAQTCGGQVLDLKPEHCGNSCLNQCNMMGGIICGTSILRDQCCQPQFCQGLTTLTRSCLPGTRIPLGNCAPNTVVI